MPPCGVDPRHDRAAPADRIAQSILENEIAAERNDRRQLAAGRALGLVRRLQQHVAANLLQQLLLLRFLKHAEMRGHICLERKLLQQPGAESVDGLHLQSTGGLQRRGKKLPRRLPQPRGDPPRPGIRYRLIQRFIVKRGPVTERFENAVRHIGGRGLGEGETEDFLGLRTLQQEPDHALREHMGLAGACIGRHPGGRAWIGGIMLLGDQRGRDDAFVHSISLSSSARPPDNDHSRTRAKWS